MEQQTSHDAGSQNQTGSTNDSRDEHETGVSSPSAPRGFSSDEGSGWRSETETSDGNFSLSQYPLDDRSGEESAHDNGSIHDEALSSVITEISKDFISGNFTPMKCPSASGDSDSYSDGDHKTTGAVYANYPESATGMSDCDWNPYESDNNDNKTPRSVHSEGPARNPLLDTMSSAHGRQMKDSGYGSLKAGVKTGAAEGGGYDRNNPTGNKGGKFATNGKDLEHIGESGVTKNDNREYRQPVPLMTTQQFYAMYSPGHQNISYQSHDEGSQTSKMRSAPQGASQDRNVMPANHARRDSGESLPTSNLQNGQNSNEMESPSNEKKEAVLILRNNQNQNSDNKKTVSKRRGSSDNDDTRRDAESLPSSQSELSDGSSQNMPRREAGSATQSLSDGSVKTDSQVASNTARHHDTDLARATEHTSGARAISSDTSQASSKSKNDYMNVQERERLLGLPPGSLAKEPLSNSPYEQMARELMDEAESDVKTSTQNTATTGEKATKPITTEHSSGKNDDKGTAIGTQAGDVLSQGDRELPPVEDTLSKRVAKLLEDASTLGASLHKQLYSREALGLDSDDNYQLYTPNKSAEDNGTTAGGGMPTGSGLWDGSDLTRQQPKSLSSLNENWSRSGKSDHSITSSLGEEVAKLMARNEVYGEDQPKTDRKSAEKSPGIGLDSFSHTAEMESLEKYYAQERETERLLEETRARLSSGHNTNVPDPLGLRVQKVLKETSHVDNVNSQSAEPRVDSVPYSSDIPSSLDYSRLQKDLQEIQNSLSYQDNCGEVKLPTQLLLSKSPGLETSLRSDRSGESDVESARNRKLLWDHGADLGIDDNTTGEFMGTMKTDYGETSIEQENSPTSKVRPTVTAVSDLADGGYGSDTQERKNLGDIKKTSLVNADNHGSVEVVGDQLNSESEDNEGRSRLAPDVEEIIQRYQKNNKNPQQQLDRDNDTSGLASRVFHILTKEPPQKQVFGILESAMEQEREMMQRIANRSKMDSSYDKYGTPDGSFIVRDKDIKKQLEWSGMSSIDAGHSQHPDKTGISELSFLKEGKHAPFNALGNAKDFLSSQLQKNSDRTFNHSIELRTPCRNVIDCYPVYGVEKGPLGEATERKEPEGKKEAWGDVRTPQSQDTSDEEYHRRSRTPDRDTKNQAVREMVTPRLASEHFFLTDLDSTPIHQQWDRHRRLSDPRDHSPDFGTYSPDRERHTRSHSEEAASLNRDSMVDLEPLSSNTSRRSSSSPRGEDASRRRQRTEGDRQETYGGNSSPEHSPTQSGGTMSQNVSDSSFRKSRLRPYRPYGSRELYYTESPEDTGSIVDSITTAESSHTGSDDALAPNFPSQFLGTRTDLPQSSGIYSDRQHPKSDGLSTIEEKSVVTDDRERSGTDSGVDRKSTDLESVSSKGDHSDLPNSLPSDHRPDSGLDLDALKGNREDSYARRQERPGYQSDNLQYAGHCSSLDRHSIALDIQGTTQSLDRHGTTLDRQGTSLDRQGTTLDRPGTTLDRHITALDRHGVDRYGSTMNRYDAELGRHSATLGRNTGTDRQSTLPIRNDPLSRESYLFDRAPTSENLEFKDDHFSSTARSDPGEQYATPLRSHEPELSSREYRQSHVSQSHRDFMHDPIGPMRSRSKSETDLIEMSMEEHKNSSPMYGKGKNRLMDLSCQPSPIFSHHTSMNSPAVTTGRPHTPPKQEIDKHLTERIMQRPLEKGPDLVSGPSRQSDRPVGSYLDRVATKPVQSGVADDNYTSRPSGRITPEYRDHTTGNYHPEPSRYSSNPGHTEEKLRVPRAAAYCDKTGKPLNELPLSEPSTLDQRSSNELPRSNIDLPRPLEPGPGLEARPLEPGQDILGRTRDPVSAADERAVLINRPLEPGPDYNTQTRAPLLSRERFLELTKDSQTTRDRPRTCGLSNPSPADDQEFTELIPDADFEDTMLEEREKLRQQKREELIREVQAKARRNQGRIVSAEEEAEFGAELDKIPPSKKAQLLRDTLQKEYRATLHPDINEMWQRFQDINQAHSDSSMDTSRIDTLSRLLKNPTKHVVQKHMDDRIYERVKEKQLLEELAKADKEQSKLLEEMQRKDLERRRRENEHRQGLSEEEMNGSYGEILARNEQRKKMEMDKNKKEKDNKNTGSKSRGPRMETSADTLYSIPEDSSFEVMTPNTTKESDLMLKAKHSRHRHVIDPLMKKLRDKVQRQRDKIDKERRKEIQRMDKLKKLEMLLGAKKKGKLSDKAIGVELDLVSSTTSTALTTESSTLMDTDSTLTLDTSSYSNPVSMETTSKDSSTEVQVHLSSPPIQKKRSSTAIEAKHRGKSSYYVQEDTEESSIFQKPVKVKSGKTSKTKSGKVKVSDELVDRKSLIKKLRNKENVERFLEQMDVGLYQEDLTKSKRSSKSPVSQRTKTVGTMCPSPVIASPPTRRKKSKKIYMVSEGVQTSPYVSHHNEKTVIPVPLMSPEVRRKRSKSPSLSTSPARSSSRSPVRSMTFKPPRHRSPISSPSRTVSFNTTSPLRSRSLERKARARSPLRPQSPEDTTYKTKQVPPPKSKMFTPETPEENCIAKLRDSPNRGISWYIPASESKPWRKPFREQQAYVVAKEPWQPKSIHPADWKAMNRADILSRDVSRDTKFHLDPAGQTVENLETSDEENVDPLSRPLSKMSLQEAFQARKQATISHLRERQKRVKLASQERQLQNYWEQERNEIFNDGKAVKESNPEAHPYSENLHKPKRRTITKEEMKALTQRLYKKLPEVVAMKQLKKRDEDYSLNRLKAKVFNRKVQNHVLKKAQNS